MFSCSDLFTGLIYWPSRRHVPQWEQVDRLKIPKKGTIYMKCTQTSYTDFVFISGILWSMCITRNYYACLVLLNFFFLSLLTITPEYSRGGDAKIQLFFFCFVFLKETMELRIIHTFSVPVPFVSLLFPHDYMMSYSSKGGTYCCLHHKKCNKCLQLTGFNIFSPLFLLVFFSPWKIN